MIRLSDFLVKTIKDYADTVYMVTGGGAMHLNDAFGKSNMKIVYCHHEQACSIAAESYSRITNKLAIVNVTTGPGGINAINGVFGAWTDSIPMLIVSGQVKRETLVSSYGENGGWRQLGDQENDIVNMVNGITKYSILINDPMMIKYHLKKAIYLALNGRKGPCWIDVPIDLQSMQIDETKLIDFDPKEYEIQSNINSLDDNITKSSKRPVFYIGSGIHSCGLKDDFIKMAEMTGVPVVTAWNSNDLIEDDHPLYVGRPGTIGNRSGNFVVQSADLVIVLGSRLNIRLVSYNWASFAKNAIKVGVDIDVKELNKPTCNFDHKFNHDLGLFIPAFLNYLLNKNELQDFSNWVAWGKERLAKYPVCLEEYWLKDNGVNPLLMNCLIIQKKVII